MRRNTLYIPPPALDMRVRELQALPGFNRSAAELLLHVELAFALMERLGLDDEPITSLWAILSGMPLRHPRLDTLDVMARHAIANARQIVPYSSRFAWIDALRAYIRTIPLRWRNYDFDTERLDDHIINAVKRAPDQIHQEHEQIYAESLSTTLPFRTRERLIAKADTPYQFAARTAGRNTTMAVQFTQAHIDATPTLNQPWLPQPRARTAFSVHIKALEDVAVFLDRREAELAIRYGWREHDKGNWRARYDTIHFHTVRADKTLSERNANDLVIDGFTHLAGMVGSGKSTLWQLLAGEILLNWPNLRMTIVVGDVQTAIQLANQINWWFCDDPERDTPMAVPLIGRSQRDAHLRGFHEAKDYQTYQERNQRHWGERWLNTACFVQGLLSPEERSLRLDGQPLIPGSEPCHSLREIATEQRKGSSAPHLCPFFARCPSQQRYRDMVTARIWITTPGALAMSAVPQHLETRPIKIGELVYEQSDAVVFDEADTVMQWFDNVYAETVTLTSGNNGVLDDVSRATSEFSIANRTPSPPTQRWIWAERSAEQAVTVTLTLLNTHLGHTFLRNWIKRGFFTPNTLCYRLARRIVGLREFDQPDLTGDVIVGRRQQTQEVLRHFDQLLDQADPLQVPRPQANPHKDPIFRLSQILQQINNNGESASDTRIHTQCLTWITDFCPDTEQRLADARAEIEEQATKHLAQQKGQRDDDNDLIDTLETLAYRLQFTLNVMLLDRHTRIVFYEWHNHPPNIERDQPYRRMPAAMLDILPLPPTGRQFGTYYAQQNSDQPGNDNYLSLFAYTNIGRWYVLNFHRLLSDLDSRRGPNVLALSGTSFLPDSTSFHISDPAGVLLPGEDVRKAIADSQFTFLPQMKRNGEGTIRISGASEQQKAGLFRDMARALVGEDRSGPLGQELTNLIDVGTREPGQWADRARLLLLVNSYDQARWAADELRQCWPSMAKGIFHLKRGDRRASGEKASDDKNAQRSEGGLNRTDIETFAQTDGIILVAPLNAIGRGFNIRNTQGTAAFGAVYFLTRPYPHPHDPQAIVREINRRALDWAADPTFSAWEADGVLQRAEAVRQHAASYWRAVEQRSYYRTLRDNPVWRARPRHDLAATTAGYIVQAVGRLLRGGVPFHAYFIDEAWAPKSAKENSDDLDTEETSLLVAMILRLAAYAADENTVGWALYKPLADALERIKNVRW